MGSRTSQGQREGAPGSSGPAAPGSLATAACEWALLAAGLTLLLASILHSGVGVPLAGVTFRDPFPEAAIPEAVLGVLCLGGALSMLAGWSAAYPLAVGAVGLSLLGTGYGLSVTVGGARAGDIAYHLGLLALLLASGALLLRGDVRRVLTGVGRVIEPS